MSLHNFSQKVNFKQNSMNQPLLSNRQSLTGDAEVESLNVIYNRVTLLKSKNVSRKLMQKDNYQSTELPNDDNRLQPSRRNFQNNESIVSSNSLANKRRILQDKETDDLQTNFWPSQNIIQKSRYKISISNQRNESTLNVESTPRRQFITPNQALNKISKTISHKPPLPGNNIQGNRAYLMSDFKKNSNNQTPPQNNTTKNIENTQNKPKNSSLSRKRPFTSSVGRQRISFRINESSKAKYQINVKPVKPFNTSLGKTNSKRNLGQTRNQQNGSRKSLTGSQVSLITGQKRAQTYKREIKKFQQLYECLSDVLGSIRQGTVVVQKVVSRYANYIQSKKLTFIDDFIEDRELKLQKLVKTTRLHETLSICYLFLQMAQQRVQDNESYLVNFIGHSLSNLLLVLRLYILKERRNDYEKSDFEDDLLQMEISSYGQQLVSQSDILLRIQHNNEIITMIHKRLGRNNEKFESCIQNFFKNAERQKHSCSICAYYIFEFLSMHIHELELFDISPTLQLSPQPYTPPAQKEYTLVIEPLGILERGGKYRPYLNQFMKWASKNFDVVLWTWQLPVAVAEIYEFLSPHLTSRLYRHHCRRQNGIYVKDLSRLGRNLQKTIIIDFDKRIFGGHPANGIECRWKGNGNDKNLLILSEIFEEMINSATSIQDTLTFYSEEILSIRGY